MNINEILELLQSIFKTKEQIEEWIYLIGDNHQRKGIKKAVKKALKAETKEEQEKALKKVRKWLWEK